MQRCAFCRHQLIIKAQVFLLIHRAVDVITLLAFALSPARCPISLAHVNGRTVHDRRHRIMEVQIFGPQPPLQIGRQLIRQQRPGRHDNQRFIIQQIIKMSHFGADDLNIGVIFHLLGHHA